MTACAGISSQHRDGVDNEEESSGPAAVTGRSPKLLPIQTTRNGTPIVCILLENSFTIWRLSIAIASKSPSNVMKLKYYSWVLIGHKCARFLLTLYGSPKGQNELRGSVFRSALFVPDSLRNVRSLNSELLRLPNYPARAGKPVVCPR